MRRCGLVECKDEKVFMKWGRHVQTLDNIIMISQLQILLRHPPGNVRIARCVRGKFALTDAQVSSSIRAPKSRLNFNDIMYDSDPLRG